MHAYVHMFVYVHIYIHVYIYTYVRVCLHANVCMCLCRFLNVRVCVCIYIYVYVTILLHCHHVDVLYMLQFYYDQTALKCYSVRAVFFFLQSLQFAFILLPLCYNHHDHQYQHQEATLHTVPCCCYPCSCSSGCLSFWWLHILQVRRRLLLYLTASASERFRDQSRLISQHVSTSNLTLRNPELIMPGESASHGHDVEEAWWKFSPLFV